MDVNKLILLLRGHKTYIQTHNFPDPDAIASAFGLQSFLKYHGIDTTICYDGKIDKLNAKRMVRIFEIDILSKDEIIKMDKDDYIITVDAQKNNANITDLIGEEVACVDHHPTVVDCEYKYKDVRIVGACSSIIASYFYDTNTPIYEDVATALTYGIKMDTSEFSRGVTDLDIEMFGKLFKVANKEKLASMYNNIMEFQDLMAYGAAIENIYVKDKTGFAYIPFDCPDALIATISDFILSVNTVDVAVVYALRDGGIKFSVRSEILDVSAGEIIRLALTGYGNGGGHHSMAGGFIPKNNVLKLGKNFEFKVRELFLEAMKVS